ncbi:MAG: type 1 glutamine amidotransferase-like domain-containing protein [bacterium]|nr:type 1 glutamine amidotransferase-like domain-containing protein [bacterium]
MVEPIKPIFLFADSQLLFWQEGDQPFLQRAREAVEAENPQAAYVGASNGDDPVFFELFRSAMEGIGITECRMIPSEPSAEDLEFCGTADLMMLAGGDVKRGWDVMKDNGVSQKIIEIYYGGGVLMGVSAGAIQLGLYGWSQDEEGEVELFETVKLVPALIDVHQEPDWIRLTEAVPKLGEYIHGVGIPSGGGVIVHADKTLEPVRRSLVDMRLREGEVQQTLIFPPGPEGEEAGPEDEAAAEEAAGDDETPVVPS